MNADSIVVITGGELVEQGSHEDLIRANGKYADLWAKQIFVRPKDKEEAEDKAAVKEAKTPTILNDLTAEETSSELAKVNSTPALSTMSNEHSKDSASSSGSSSSDETHVEVRSRSASFSGHTKEV
ncbi:hypothetical protein B0T26DRAFT_635589 [Lasiosphaeria miniovina]|uniref:Uncharacterized protein n=1 Tax=Lasiosphaeria miniovina TaxID=1954250 RepID=A0AA40BIP0_9PEZI|nr:uncharacterized protein B0T26DRAFT_635589 [Lasiosphaeria miniovina]KAK0734925.1 hypothetical protein B0T26DRAFT_635589 [Lasiosphaeria miniovina]